MTTKKLPLRAKLIQGERLSVFSGRSLDIGVVLDVMIHDIDMALAVARAPVREVDAVGVSVLGGHEDIAQARLTFANGCSGALTKIENSNKNAVSTRAATNSTTSRCGHTWTLSTGSARTSWIEPDFTTVSRRCV